MRTRSLEETRDRITGAEEYAKLKPMSDDIHFAVQQVRNRMGLPPLDNASVQYVLLRGTSYNRKGEEISVVLPVIKFEEIIGKGGFNEIRRVIDGTTEVDLVARVPNGECKSFITDQQKERRKKIDGPMAQRHHPQMPVDWATGFIEGEFCELIERVKGKDLQKYSIKNLREFFVIGKQCIHLIRHWLRHNWMHLDIKPENFFYDETTGHVYLLDKDLRCSPDDMCNDVKCYSSYGTVPYMAVERFSIAHLPTDPSKNGDCAKAGEVYSLGLTLYYFLTHTLPLDLHGKTIDEMVRFKGSNAKMRFVFPENIPQPLQELIEHMCDNDWRKRPSIEEVHAIFATLKSELTVQGAIQIALSSQGAKEKTDKVQEFVKGYVCLNDNYFPYKWIDSHEEVQMALFEDRVGRKLLAIPRRFTREEDAKEFYAQRVEFLEKLNGVRKEHHNRFPGTYNIVLDCKEKIYTVWTIRPFLESHKTLSDYLNHCLPKLQHSDRLRIILTIIESLWILEKAGYKHFGVTKEKIYLIPPEHTSPADEKTQALSQRGQQISNEYPFSAFSSQPDEMNSRSYRLEVMYTNDSIKIEPPDKDVVNVESVCAIIHKLLPQESQDIIVAIKQFDTWEQRTVFLRTLLMQDQKA